MRLVVLGSGTCRPSGIRASSGYWIDGEGYALRLDCGSGTVHAMARHGLPWESLTHQVVSHFHIDHCGELAALLFAFKYGRDGDRSQPLCVVGPHGIGALLDGFQALFGTRILEQEFPIEIVEIADGEGLQLSATAKLLVAKTPHTGESLAVRIEDAHGSIGYTGDTLPSPHLAEFFGGVDVLVAECSFLDDRRGTAHLVASDVAELASTAGVGHLVATHCYFDPEEARLAERLAEGYSGQITIAFDGLALTLTQNRSR